MNTTVKKTGGARRNTIIYFLLIVLTLTTWYMGSPGLGNGLITALVLATAFIKGHFIISDFMQLKNVSFAWRALVHGWLLVLIGGIGFAYSLGV